MIIAKLQNAIPEGIKKSFLALITQRICLVLGTSQLIAESKYIQNENESWRCALISVWHDHLGACKGHNCHCKNIHFFVLMFEEKQNAKRHLMGITQLGLHQCTAVFAIMHWLLWSVCPKRLTWSIVTRSYQVDRLI